MSACCQSVGTGHAVDGARVISGIFQRNLETFYPWFSAVPFTFAVDDVPVWSHLVCKHSTVTSDVIYTFNPGVDSHNAVGQQIIPFSFDLNPSGHHPAISIEIIPATVDQFPVTFRTSTVSMSIPPFAVTSLNPFAGLCGWLSRSRFQLRLCNEEQQSMG